MIICLIWDWSLFNVKWAVPQIYIDERTVYEQFINRFLKQRLHYSFMNYFTSVIRHPTCWIISAYLLCKQGTTFFNSPCVLNLMIFVKIYIFLNVGCIIVRHHVTLEIWLRKLRNLCSLKSHQIVRQDDMVSFW
jgi:hypothetical protein